MMKAGALAEHVMEEVTLEEDWDARYRKFGSDSGTTPRMFPALRPHLLLLLLTSFAPDSIERQSRCFLRVSGSRSDAISRWKVLLCSGRSHGREGQQRGRRRGCSGVGRRHSRAGAASTLFLPAHITAARMSRAANSFSARPEKLITAAPDDVAPADPREQKAAHGRTSGPRASRGENPRALLICNCQKSAGPMLTAHAFTSL